MNRVKSHPDVSERWYPEQLAEIRRQQAEEEEKMKGITAVAGLEGEPTMQSPSQESAAQVRADGIEAH